MNLIGEHTDYNDGLVCPMAIEPHKLFTFRRRDDRRLRVASSHVPGEVIEFDLSGDVPKGEPKWSNYVRGAAALLKVHLRQFVDPDAELTGIDLFITTTLPVGGGLSSSAALEVGTVSSLLRASGRPKMDAPTVAAICQRAEHEYADVPCGIMDQMIVAGGRIGHAMLLDCRSMQTRMVPVDSADVVVVVVNSMVRHELSGGEYAERRRQCEAAVDYFHSKVPTVTALRDVTVQQVIDAEGDLPDVTFRRARHVVTEIDRAARFADLMGKTDYAGAGELMVDSHISLSDDYQVSVPELDFLAFEATRIDGCYGSRMTGGGFGGCTVSLVTPNAAPGFVEAIRAAYHDRYGVTPDAFTTTATDGAAVVG